MPGSGGSLTMNAIAKTSLELLVLGLLAIGLGFGANGVRGSGSIKPTKNYFDKGNPGTKAKPDGGALPANGPTPVATAGAGLSSPPPASSLTSKSGAAKHLQHDYREISFEEVVEVWNDPQTAQGLNIFVDARKADLFNEGHIPGAVHCDSYEPQGSIENVVARAGGVERVIVYCGGGDCEDSVFMCRELIEAGVPNETLFLYSGGWSEWTAKKMPVSTERDE